jgi:hypothetical protein
LTSSADLNRNAEEIARDDVNAAAQRDARPREGRLGGCEGSWCAIEG